MSEESYPEHDKLHVIKDKSEEIYEFLAWLQGGEADTSRFKRPVFLATHAIDVTYLHPKTREECTLPESEWEVNKDKITTYDYVVQKLLAKYFKIDLDKLEDEKRSILKSLSDSAAEAFGVEET